jgi:hypothetical protein
MFEISYRHGFFGLFVALSRASSVKRSNSVGYVEDYDIEAV